MTNTPCPTPNICGVQTHRPGTEARCRKGKLDSKGSNSRLTNTSAPKTNAVPVGQESLSVKRAFARDRALYVDAGEESFIVFVEDFPGELHPQGEALLMTAGAVELKKEGHLSIDDVALPIRQNYTGELWVQQNYGQGTLYTEAVKLSDLKDGDRHPSEEDWHETPEDGDKFNMYKALRRLESNPKAKEWLQKNAQIEDPLGRDEQAGAYVKPWHPVNRPARGKL